MKSVDSKIYNKKYYFNSCMGFEEFKKHRGKKVHPNTAKFLSMINFKSGIKLLDVGCGRGDLVIEAARRGAEATGIDYSRDAVVIAKSMLDKQEQKIQKKVKFYRMDFKKLKFPTNYFDVITSYDVFEHLYKEELEIAMGEVSRVLKPGGILIVHTETNKIYLDFTHRVWAYPLDSMLIVINKLITGKEYPGLQRDPRNDLHKAQHVNEPTHFYLKRLFKSHNFKGKIINKIPLKPKQSWKDGLHNFVVSLHPISGTFPLHLLFAHEYICYMINNKKI